MTQNYESFKCVQLIQIDKSRRLLNLPFLSSTVWQKTGVCYGMMVYLCYCIQLFMRWWEVVFDLSCNRFPRTESQNHKTWKSEGTSGDHLGLFPAQSRVNFDIRIGFLFEKKVQSDIRAGQHYGAICPECAHQACEGQPADQVQPAQVHERQVLLD